MSSLRTYVFLVRTFRNWPSLIRNLRRGGYSSFGPVLKKLVLWGGETIQHPPWRAGLAPMLMEVWVQNVYRLGEFYRPKASDVVVDIGAHVGLFTLRLLREQAQCRVLAVEPSPENFACLTRNVSQHVLRRNARIINAAVGADFGKVSMMDISTNRSFDARTRPALPNEPAATDVVPLSKALELAGSGEVALLKIDAEGGEHGAFATASPAVLSRIQRIAMEYHDHLMPGTLALIRQRLEPTHDLEVFPEPGVAHGRLFARRKDLSAEQTC